jgi:23S rRNA pseudouridine1911/1915/1917 synthase
MLKQNSIRIIYEDNDIIVIDKPAGMLSVSTDKADERTAYRAVNNHVRSRRKNARIWIVHRLDRDTSGVMLFAKSEQVKSALQNDWNNTAIAREYAAVVEGRVQPAERRIRSWLKQTSTFRVYSCNRGEKGGGKLAITNYRTLKTSPKYTMLGITLETGRKNQIRVHMKDIGYPIVGDSKYGATASKNPLRRLGLHASALTVKHPVTGEEMRFTAAIPAVFERMFGGNKTT